MRPHQPRTGVVVRGAILPEPVEVVAVVPLGDAVKLVGKGLRTGKLHDPVRLGGVPVVRVEHYHVTARAVLAAAPSSGGGAP